MTTVKIDPTWLVSFGAAIRFGLFPIACLSMAGIAVAETDNGAWHRTGDAVGPNEFIGTSNGVPLILKQQGQTIGYLRFLGGAPWVVFGATSNWAFGQGGTVSGGGSDGANCENIAGGSFSTISGGLGNNAFGHYSSVAGGYTNFAGGDYSWAGGRRAKVRARYPNGASVPVYTNTPAAFSTSNQGDKGTFIWADSTDADFVSTGEDQFLVRAGGGFYLNANTGTQSGDDVVLKARPISGDLDVDVKLISRSGKAALVYLSDASGTLYVTPQSLASGSASRLVVGGGTVGSASLSYGGTWTNASSVTYKEDRQAIDAEDILTRVTDLKLTSWRYIGSEEGRHIGPMAEDFHAAFQLGVDPQSIATVDADGIALAAIQGLHRKVVEENAQLRAELDALRIAVKALQENRSE